MQAYLYSERGELEEAEQFATLAIEQKDDRPDSYYVRAGLLYKQGKFERALADADEALRLQPKSVKYLKGRADIHLAIGQYEAASADLKMTLLRNALSELPFDLQQDQKYLPASADRAMEQLGNWLELNPGHEELRFQRAAWFIRHESYDEALLDLNCVIEAGLGRDHAYIARGMVHEELKHFERSELDFAEALKLDKDNLDVIMRRCVLHGAMLDFAGVIKGCNLVLKKHPDNSLVLMVRARVHIEMGELEEALKDLEHVLRNDSGNLEILDMRAVIRIYQEEFARAKEDCDAILARQPADGRAPFLRAYCSYRLGELEEALANVEAFHRRTPKDLELHLLGIEIRFLLKQYDQVIAHCNPALEAAPNEARLYLTRGLILHHFGNTASAREDFEAAIKLGLQAEHLRLAKERMEDPEITELPNNSPLQSYLLTLYKKSKEKKKDLEILNRKESPTATKEKDSKSDKEEKKDDKKILPAEPTHEDKVKWAKSFTQKNPDSIQARLNLAQLLSQNHANVGEAILECDEVLKRDPTVAMAYVIRARLYAYRAEYAKANKDAQRAFELDPSQGLIKYERPASVYDESVKAAEAAPQPKNEEELLLTLGDEQLASQHYAVAINLYNKAITANPQGARQHYHRGLAYAAMQEWEKASADMQKSIELAPENVELLSGTAWFLATASEAKWRNADLAVKLATKACELSQGKEGRCLGTLAAAFAAAGNYAEAVKYQKQAQSLYTEEEQAAYGYLIALYESKQPYQPQP